MKMFLSVIAIIHQAKNIITTLSKFPENSMLSPRGGMIKITKNTTMCSIQYKKSTFRYITELRENCKPGDRLRWQQIIKDSRDQILRTTRKQKPLALTEAMN